MSLNSPLKMILKIFVVAIIMAIAIASGDDKIPTNRAVNSPDTSFEIL